MTYKPPEGLTRKQTEKELEKAVYDFEHKVRSGCCASSERLSDFIPRYFELYGGNQSPATVAFSRSIVEPFIMPQMGNMRLDAVKPLHVQKYINALSDAGLSASTVRRYLTVLKSIFGKAYKLGLIDNNPTESSRLELPEARRTNIDIFTRDQMRAIVACLDEEPLAFQVMIHLAITTGARRGELAALEWDCIDLKNRAITIRQSSYKLHGQDISVKEPKTAGSVRTVSIPEYLVPILRKYKHEQLQRRISLGTAWNGGNWVFTKWDGSIMNPQTPTKQFSKFLERHGLPHRKFHALRHTSATLLLSDGTDIKTVGARLGHTQLSTTNLYVHALRDADKAAAETFDNLFAGEKRA